MAYIACKITVQPFMPFNEILVAQLSELDFESFTEEERENVLIAYIPADEFQLSKVKSICSALKDQAKIELEVNTIEKENWNKKWEENFEPIQVDQFCLIRAPFHTTKSKITHEVIIEPKMSFGTGHHQTTQMMIALMKDDDYQEKTILDMGSGTGILAILAKKMGAKSVDAIDIEEWAFENMQENASRNEVTLNCFLGDAALLKEKKQQYDVVFANINKNILLNDMSQFDEVLKPNGELHLSGFFTTDEAELLSSISLKNYIVLQRLEKESWSALKLQKQ
ncbi:MAG: 50S ribosomal protein L11 methyltransferase [Vicingaceae bacterium]